VQFGQTTADPSIITRVASAPATEKSQIPKNAQVHSTPGSAYRQNSYQQQSPYQSSGAPNLTQESPYQEGKPKDKKYYNNYPQQQYGQEFYPQYQQYNQQFYNNQQYPQTTTPSTPSWTPAKTSVKIVLKDPNSKDEIILPIKSKLDSPKKDEPKTPTIAQQTPKKPIVLKDPLTGMEILTPVKVKISQPVFETATVETAAPSPAKIERAPSPKRAQDSEVLKSKANNSPVKTAAVPVKVTEPVVAPAARQVGPVITPAVRQVDPVITPAVRQFDPVITPAVRQVDPVITPAVRQVDPAKSIKRPASPLKTVKGAPAPVVVEPIPSPAAQAPAAQAPAVEKIQRAASPAKMAQSPSRQPELEEGEIVEKKTDVIRADARLLTPAEFSKVKYPAGVVTPKLTDGVLKYTRDFFHAIMEKIKSQPQGFPALASVYGEHLRDNGGAGRGLNMSRQNSSHGRGRGGKRGDRENRGAQMMSRQDSGNRGTIKGKRALPPPLPALVKGESAWDAKKIVLNEDEVVLKLSKGIFILIKVH
jgi:hypothetical protein